MCESAVEYDPDVLAFVADHFKTREMCQRAVEKDPYTLKFVPDWFVTQEQVKIWHDDNYYCHDNKIVEWYEGYKKRKAQKAQINEEFMTVVLIN